MGLPMSRFAFFKAIPVLAVCSFLVACGGNPSVHSNPKGVDGNDAGAAAGGQGPTDDPLSLGGAFDGQGGEHHVGTGMPACGGAALDDGEECDDGNTAPDDGCSETCTLEDGFNCVVAGASCEECGNGVKESAEACDDGNQDDDDGCSADCQTLEPGFNCPIPSVACEQCGNGKLDPNETCDDGNATDDDGCSASCTAMDPGYNCSDA